VVFSSNDPLILVVTGCLALLAGLFGGIKLKDIELPTISRLPRVLSGLVGVLLIGSAMWLYIHPSTLPTPAATATPSPSSSTAIVPDPTNPAGFLRYYFDLLTEHRNYGDAWKLLTKRYQRQFYASNFAAYEGYWGTVQRVNLDRVQVTQVSATSVDSQVDMTLIMTNGQEQQLTANYRLIYNPNARTWMFDTP
jgi:hypothetical protein